MATGIVGASLRTVRRSPAGQLAHLDFDVLVRINGELVPSTATLTVTARGYALVY